jgi:hypothetical protein
LVALHEEKKNENPLLFSFFRRTPDGNTGGGKSFVVVVFLSLCNKTSPSRKEDDDGSFIEFSFFVVDVYVQCGASLLPCFCVSTLMFCFPSLWDCNVSQTASLMICEQAERKIERERDEDQKKLASKI